MKHPFHLPSRRTTLKFLGLTAALTGAVLWLIAYHIGPHAILHPPRAGSGAVPPAGVTARDFRLGDGITLRYWIALPEKAPTAVVLVLHGIADSKASQAGTIRFLADRGIAGIAVDLRAHGDSGGEFATYGFLEKADLSQVLEVIDTEFPGLPVGLWGTSYGGAVALQSLAREPRFDFAIVESTFANLPDMARQGLANHTSLPLQWLAPIALRRAGETAGMDPSAVSPELAMEKVAVPVLHLHGDRDEVIPLKHALRISRHARHPGYRFVPISGGTHFHIREGDINTYNREVDSFLGRVAPPRP